MEQNYWSRALERRINRRKILSAAGGIAAASTFLAACGGDDSGEDQSGVLAQPVDTTKQARRGLTMKDRAFSEAPTLDVLTANNPWNAVGFDVYSMLVQFKPGYLKGPEAEVAPDLAESWEIAPDGLTVTMKLRQGVQWHDKPPVNGRPLEMDDVLSTWNRYATKHTNRINLANSAHPDAPVLSMSAADSKTLVVKLKEPIVYALSLLIGGSSNGLIIVPKETDSTLDLRGEMLGTGPWYLANYSPSVGYTLKRHPNFYDKDWALVDQVEKPIISEYSAALAQFKAGNIYSFGSYGSGSPVKSDDALALKQDDPRIGLYVGDFGRAGNGVNRLNFGWLPEGKSPFVDKRVRQAVSMSWQRDLYLETFFNLSSFAARGVPLEARWNSHLPATQEGWWLDPKGKDFGPNAKYFEHNLAEAKKLLAAAGYPNGFEVASNYVTGPELGTLPNHAEVVDGFARELGLTIRQNKIDYLKEYVPVYRNGQGQLFEGWSYGGGGGGAPDPVNLLANEFWSKSGTFKGFSVSGKSDLSGDPQVDALIEKARVEQDVEKRRALVFDLQRNLAESWYTAAFPGQARELTVAWPCLGNFRVYQGARNNYRLWVDDTKAPFKSA